MLLDEYLVDSGATVVFLTATDSRPLRSRVWHERLVVEAFRDPAIGSASSPGDRGGR
jgi:hypothetical protein